MRRFVCVSISNAARRHKLCVLSRQQEQLLGPIVLDVARWLGVTGDSPPPATMISYADDIVCWPRLRGVGVDQVTDQVVILSANTCAL